MSTNETALIAHLMRRAGFGARYDEIEALAEQGYDATVDWLLNPVGEPETDDDITLRFTPMHVDPQGFVGPASRWLYRILNTRRPLERENDTVLALRSGDRILEAELRDGDVASLRDAACSCDGELPRTAASDFQRPGDDLLAGQLRQPRRHA